ncbi:hypothetical protein P280DRAFT_468376 [Massarina eburnea CBS 473.64]|uniref:Uncharacterized protein n=1 Tax=Massarina eburnea CBS 473.64 TaxID=1395130 RepID=A0A6A6S641_9PLEO|nr:hypothetical protein P280DRAFT_468376 [Massarina eburnea CBS 473.64]
MLSTQLLPLAPLAHVGLVSTILLFCCRDGLSLEHPPMFPSLLFLNRRLTTYILAPNFVYSECFVNPDGTNSLWLCQTSCTWQLIQSPSQC